MNIDAFRHMVEKNPKGFLGRYGLGNKILQEGGNVQEAVEHLKVATELDPTHVASHLALGRALASWREHITVAAIPGGPRQGPVACCLG